MQVIKQDYKLLFENAKAASGRVIAPEVISAVLNRLAERAIAETGFLITENRKDLDRMDAADPKFDRLMLSAERIAQIAAEIRNVASLENPLGKLRMQKTMPNGLNISKVSVPLGVVGVIYEARPNVTFDVFSLCFKCGNVCILKGGSDAEYSNNAIISLIHRTLEEFGIDINMATLLPAGRDAATALMEAVGYVDVLIPRGSQQLINSVRENSKVPVIETGAGIVHTYFDESGDLEKGKNIVCNAKTRRVSVCNALDCLIVHYLRLKDLPALLQPLGDKKVGIYADKTAFTILKGHYPDSLLYHAQPEHFGTEFLSMKMAVKVVDNLDEALEHIARYSSKHSEAIIAEDTKAIEIFLNRTDAAAVYANASTAFTDGAQFGLGAEIGISTQKLHARGPMGLEELTSYKWIVRGTGQTRA